jgi:hypothetical protein
MDHTAYFLLASGAVFIQCADAANATNNTTVDYKALTDIAPLLALLGERYAQQFLAESYTFYDYIREWLTTVCYAFR